MKRQAIYLEIVCGLLILLFMYAGISKLLTHRSFNATLAAAPLLGKFHVVIGIAVPSFEIVLALLLCTQRFRLPAMFGTLLLLLVFSAYIIYTLLSNPGHAMCGCGGVLSVLTWKTHILFNLLFIIINCAGLIIGYRSNILLQQTGRKLKTLQTE